MVNPREHRVVVVESLLCPTHFRNTLARVLFNHLNVSLSLLSVVWAGDKDIVACLYRIMGWAPILRCSQMCLFQGAGIPPTLCN